MPTFSSKSDWALTRIIRAHQMSAFFVLTFLLSWFPWYMGIAVETLIIGPSIAAFIIVMFLDGKSGLVDLLRPFLRWRASANLWLIAIFGNAVLFMIGIGVFVLMGGTVPPFFMITNEMSLLPVYLFLVVLMPLNGPIGEEFGWRGFAQPRLQSAHGPLIASIVIGVVWGLWHLPDLLQPGGVLGSLTANIGLGFIALYTFGNIASSVYITWLYNKTKKSALIAAVVWHAAIDFWAPVLLSDGSLRAAKDEGILPKLEPALYLTVLGVLVAGAFILVISTKGRLGLADDNT